MATRTRCCPGISKRLSRPANGDCLARQTKRILTSISRLPGMTSKIKIRIAIALIAFGALGWGLWPREEHLPVTVTYVGVSPTNANVVEFTVSNGTDHYVEGDYDLQVMFNSNRFRTFGRFNVPVGPLESGDKTNFLVPVTGRWPWRISFNACLLREAGPVVCFREDLGQFLFDHEWQRLGSFIYPFPTWEAIPSVTMLGHQPAPGR